MAGFFELAFLILLAPIFSLFAVSIRAAFLLPLYGSLVRWRGNFSPMGVTLDETQEARVGPVSSSILAMGLRVKRLEGWRGLYKGIIPYIISHTISFSVVIIFLGASSSFLPTGGKMANPSGLRMGLVTVALTLIQIPFTVLINRAITTPYQLPSNFKGYQTSIRLLLTPTERAKPWTLYLTPGLAISTAWHVFCTVLLMRLVRDLFLPGWAQGETIDIPADDADPLATDPTSGLHFSAFRYICFFLFQALGTPVLTALEVIATRLSLQRNHAMGEQDDGLTPGEVPYSAEGQEDVVGFRDESEPYTGLLDCAIKMRDEEGPLTLLRGWWIELGFQLIRGIP